VNNGNGGVETTSLTSQLTIEFGADGEVSGFSGCTDFSGTYATDGPAISITELAAGDCSDTSLAPQQEQYLSALAAATNFSIDGARLDLRDEAGALQAGFTAQ
jgi:putative lipoprotein